MQPISSLFILFRASANAVLAAYYLSEPEDVAMLPAAAHRKITAIARTVAMTRRIDLSISDTVGTLADAAKRYFADLVVIGRGKHTNPLRLGTNVGDIITRLSCPVLTVGTYISVEARPGQRT